MSPREIADKILNCKTYNIPEIQNLARAYLELEKKNLSLTQALENYHDQLNSWDRERIDAGHEQVVFELKSEITKLKKSREGLRKACEKVVNSIQHQADDQFVLINVIGFDEVREAIKADEELMKEGGE